MPCSRRESPRIPTQAGSTMTGLSRRRSRVRVPSLPLKDLQSSIFRCLAGRERPPAFRRPLALISDGDSAVRHGKKFLQIAIFCYRGRYYASERSSLNPRRSGARMTGLSANVQR
jgi:hypothetical protein